MTKLTPQTQRDAALREYANSTAFIDPKTGEEYAPDELPEVPVPDDDDKPKDD